MTADEAKPTPRRQARGQQRIEQILRAAAEVFAEHGYEGATTNAIAAQAGISPGSLYQFFKNKDDIARGLADFYAARMQSLQQVTFDPEQLADLPIQVLVAQVVEPLVDFNLGHPGFKSLFARTDMPPKLRDAVAPIHERIHQRVGQLLHSVNPDAAPDVIDRTATVAIQLVRAMMPLIVAAEGDEREALVHELEGILVGYLGPVATRS